MRNVFGPSKIPHGLERGGTLESAFLFLILLNCNILALLLLVRHCSHMDYHRETFFYFYFIQSIYCMSAE